jgi:uncharacterized protein (DUF1778 family)
MRRSSASKLKVENGGMLSAPLSVSFTVAERAQVKEAAKLSDESVSAFIRAAAVKAAQRVARQALRGMDRAA